MAIETAKRLMARVREFREALGLTQEKFAERAGLKYKYYQHLEAGRRRDIRYSTLQKLAKACQVELWELLNFEAELGLVGEDPAEKSPELPARRRRKGHPAAPRNAPRT